MKLTNAQKLKFRRVRRLAQMQKMNPIEFEHFVGWLYKKKGYRVGTTVTTGDEGIDLTLSRWGRKTVVQVKRYKGTVGQPVVRDIYGAMAHAGAKEAHVVTSGRFSRQAESWAAGKPIVLVDGSDLVAWVNKGHRLQAKATGKRVYFFSPARMLLWGLIIAGILGTAYWGITTDNLNIPYLNPTPTKNLIIPIPPQQPNNTPTPVTPIIVTLGSPSENE